VHLHDRLVLGDDATKNYRLPIEDAYLASVSREGLFPVPSPELELALFVVRMMVKHGSPEAIATGRGRLSTKERAELGFLEAASDPATRWASVDSVAPMLDRDLLVRCAASLRPGAPLGERLDAWRRLRRRLAPGARRPRAVDMWLQVERRVIGRAGRRLGLRRRKTLAGAGPVIALVGGDGSGKSTAASGLIELLSPVFATARVHLGKPPRSVSWRAVRVWLHLARRLGVRAASPPSGADDGWSATPSRSRMLIVALTARDRRRAAVRAHRLAARGVIVVCDRYPLPELTVDGPRRGDAQLAGVAARLAAWERREHGRIPPPDLVVVLAVPPELAVRRRPEAPREVIEARAREILDVTWPPGVAVVDAARPREDVLDEVVARVWRAL
jgi:thymidylate kinase